MGEYGTRVGILRSWRHCPRCSAELEHRSSRVECPRCGFVHYANAVPAVAALVRDDDGRLLLARRAVEPDAGLWDTPGGFLEEGEGPEEGLRRELREEASLEIEVERFVGTYLDRYGDGEEAPWVLNLVWDARIVGGEPVPSDDVSELRWFEREGLPPAGELAFGWLPKLLEDWANAAC
jgi:ADP-ribose pyrophosphatase YjhB (NUDIX family)